MGNKKGFVLSTYVYMLLVFFLLLLTTMLAVMNNTKLLSNKLKEQSGNTSGLTDKDYSFILLGEGDMVLRRGEEYIEPGFKIQTVRGVDLNDIVSIVGNVDVTSPNTYKLTYSATYNGITKKLVRNVHVLDNIAANYITGLYNHRKDENGLINPKVTYESKEYDTGIRYTGTNPNNYIYYNCEENDSSGVSYGDDNYNYASSCEKWRVIGVFDVSDGTTTEKRVKLINTASTFKSSWDSSSSDVNSGWGINQWGASTYSDGTVYEGADLMQLLNGYYIGKDGMECIYCNDYSQAECSQVCTSDNLKKSNMKKLTTKAKSMIKNTVWPIYAVKWPEEGISSFNFSRTSYLEGIGISNQYNGKNMCEGTGDNACNDEVVRTTSWTGLVGLMSVSDVIYANGWLYNQMYTWLLNPRVQSADASDVWYSNSTSVCEVCSESTALVMPSLYLNSNVLIVGGDGTQNNPYKLSI